MLSKRRFVASLAGALFLFAIARGTSSTRVDAQEASNTRAVTGTPDDDGRPTLRRVQPANETAAKSPTEETVEKSVGPTVAPGLTLPSTGRVWALDRFEGKQMLVHLMYYPTTVDRHTASNVAKVNLAPFIAKPKMTIELRGAKAAVRLHETSPVIFVRAPQTDNEDAAVDPSQSETHTELALVKLEVHRDKRLVNTIVYTQISGKASRSESLIEVVKTQVGNSDWARITPKNPLPPGEYGLLALPKGQRLYPASVFEFAIDPEAPANTRVVLPKD